MWHRTYTCFTFVLRGLQQARWHLQSVKAKVGKNELRESCSIQEGKTVHWPRLSPWVLPELRVLVQEGANWSKQLVTSGTPVECKHPCYQEQEEGKYNRLRNLYKQEVPRASWGISVTLARAQKPWTCAQGCLLWISAARFLIHRHLGS